MGVIGEVDQVLWGGGGGGGGGGEGRRKRGEIENKKREKREGEIEKKEREKKERVRGERKTVNVLC